MTTTTLSLLRSLRHMRADVALYDTVMDAYEGVRIKTTKRIHAAVTTAVQKEVEDTLLDVVEVWTHPTRGRRSRFGMRVRGPWRSWPLRSGTPAGPALTGGSLRCSPSHTGQRSDP